MEETVEKWNSNDCRTRANECKYKEGKEHVNLESKRQCQVFTRIDSSRMVAQLKWNSSKR